MLFLHPINSLMELPEIESFLIDVFGVLYNGVSYYPHALEITRKLKEQGKKITVISNATTVGDYFIEKHEKLGFIKGVHYDDIVTSGDVLKKKLADGFLDEVAGKKGTYALIGRANDRLLADVLSRQVDEIKDASAIYLGALQVNDQYFATIDPFIPYAQEALDLGLPAICANPDYYAFKEDFKHVVQGLLAKWYEDRGGKVYWVGKPYREIFTYVLQRAQTSPVRTLMVGDTIRTDILGASNAGIKTALVTQTGIAADFIKVHSLEELIALEGARPNYLIPQLQ